TGNIGDVGGGNASASMGTSAPAGGGQSTGNATATSGNNSAGSTGNYAGGNGNAGNNSRSTKSVSEQDHDLKVGLAHVEDYKRTCLAIGTIGVKDKEKEMNGTQPEGNDAGAHNVTLSGRNLTGRETSSSTDGSRPVEVKSGTPGSLAREGYPSTTEGYPNAYNTYEKQPLMGEKIYSEDYIRKNVPEQFQEAAINAMHEEEKRGLYGSPTDSKRMTTRVGVKTKYQDRHTGIDIGALEKDENDIPIKGDPIYATADGKVIDFRYTENSGSTLLELSLPGTKDRAIYQHADFIVKPGDEVKRGQIIGYMDSINVGTNQVHLHYEIRHNGIYALSEGGVLVDPTLHMPGTYYFDKNQ
ncbi:MAG: M23 family metallopeptidase, partial [Treponema sp.]|nr:M23 family metallopeptidase [Treponema sp.]